MPALVTAASNEVLDWITNNSPTAPTFPLKLALVTAMGTASSAGTEVVGGSYARQTLTMAGAASGTTSNSAAVTFAGLPTATIVGAEIWDSAGSPVRWAYAQLAANKSVTSGDSVNFAIGTVQLALG